MNGKKYKKINFITEIASSHQGDLAIIKKISDAHLLSNLKYLKFQIFKTINLYEKKNKLFKHYKKIEISFNNWSKLINFYKKKTKLILEPFDIESYNFCKKFKDDVHIKISTSESQNLDLISDALYNFDKVFLNVSGIKYSNIKKLIKYIEKKDNKKKIILMYGFQNYPTNKLNLRIGLFDYFNKKNFLTGYADHTNFGIHEELINTNSFLISKKIKFIEKHVCLDLKKKPYDYETSLNIKDFNDFIKKLNKNRYFKKFKYKMRKRSQEEINYALRMHKFAFTKKKINKNELIKISDLKFLRSSSKIEGLTTIDFFKKEIFAKKIIYKNKQIFFDSVI